MHKCACTHDFNQVSILSIESEKNLIRKCKF